MKWPSYTRRSIALILTSSVIADDTIPNYRPRLLTLPQLFLEVNGTDTRSFCSCEKETIDAFADDNKRLFVMELLLHCADISNPVKPFNIYKKWASLVCEEFCLQGDREKAEGLEVSPMMDRDQMNLPNMQLGFIEFVVVPLYSSE